MASGIETSLIGRPYERIYRVSLRVFSPDEPAIGFDSIAWRKNRGEADRIFEETSILSLMAKAVREFGWVDALKMTAEKKLTVHVFNPQGVEIHGSEICLMEESAALQDLDVLITIGIRSALGKKGES